MKQIIPLLAAGMLLAGCATGDAVRSSDPVPPVVKATPPKPVLPPDPTPVTPAKPSPPPATSATGADIITLPASMGAVTFPHRKHQGMLNGCGSCHSGAPGTIADLGKEWAHQTCKGCHTEMKAGPTSCTGCHKK
jgi:hypothetical protein